MGSAKLLFILKLCLFILCASMLYYLETKTAKRGTLVVPMYLNGLFSSVGELELSQYLIYKSNFSYTDIRDL